MRDGDTDYEAVANGDPGAPLGRELEVADLLRHLQTNRVRNVVWITADVHYCAAHYYDPRNAKFTEFDPFWEFVAGPLNAGTFGPNELDATFGSGGEVHRRAIRHESATARRATVCSSSGCSQPTRGTSTLTVELRDLSGRSLYKVELPPADRCTQQTDKRNSDHKSQRTQKPFSWSEWSVMSVFSVLSVACVGL